SDHTVTATEDEAYVFQASDFPFSDVDGDGLASVIISSLPPNGALAYNSIALTAADIALGYRVTAADLAAHRLAFTADANDHGSNYASFQFQVLDDSVPSDIVSAWTFDGTAADVSGHGNDLVLHGGATYGQSIFAQTLALDGITGSYAQLPTGGSDPFDFG